MAASESSIDDYYYQRSSLDAALELIESPDEEVCADPTVDIRPIRPPVPSASEAVSLCVPEETYVLDGFFPCSVDPSLYAYPFPKRINDFFRDFDDTIIEFIQRPLSVSGFRSSVLIFVARFISAIFASSEVGFSIPLFILLLERVDYAAIVATYEFFFLAMLTQIPKRFVYRPRPYCESRAIGVVFGSGPATSSFPSRATTTTMVYGCFAGFVYELYGDSTISPHGIPWGPVNLEIWIIIFVLVFTVAWARMFLGCHYPSCAIAGLILGIVIHFLGVGVARAHYYGCKCSFPHTDEETVCDISNRAGLVVGIGVPLAALFELSLGLSAFWDKSTHALGLLLPPMIFILAFVCPELSGHSELHIGDGIPDKANIITALTTTIFLSLAGFATQIKHPLTESDYFRFTTFLFLMVSSLMALVGTRLIQAEADEIGMSHEVEGSNYPSP